MINPPAKHAKSIFGQPSPLFTSTGQRLIDGEYPRVLTRLSRWCRLWCPTGIIIDGHVPCQDRGREEHEKGGDSS